MAPCNQLSLLVFLILLCPVSSETINPTVQDLISRNSDFAARLYRAVASQTDGNVFLSPFTVCTGLMALLSATNGQTRDQLQQGLTLTGLDPQNIPDLFRTLKTVVLRGESSTNLHQSVMVLPSRSFEVSSSYSDLVQTKFGGNIHSLTYTDSQDAIDTINRLVQEQTKDQVQELVNNLDPQTQLLLVTAASYQTQFSPSFNSSLSQDDRFYVDRYHVVMVPMMFRAGKYFLAYDRSLKVGVLKLTMADGMAMLVVLPDEGVDITAVEDEVTSETIRAWIIQLKKTKLEVQLPRFLLECQYSLKNLLQMLGVTHVFQDNADITDMGGANKPTLTQVFHKSIVSVNERGDDIITGATPTFSALPPRLIINRPFIFVIYQQTSGSLLFLGRVVDPTKK
ncbi:protein Z-dependent protease inhibitor-like [Betta splendens]|uniref:Protein Z-dependent protease inhibitor-like n=1 Tax=Betta splendens TaxID=158456 RepID=A0A6P7LQZ9_BETSP|nr:protein Z-dependent protease inhibitor-like [Betta splendens]